MALTAWETFIEDLVREEVSARLRIVEGSYVGKFVQTRLNEELKRFNTPNSEKTRRLFQDYLEVDVTTSWVWQQIDPSKAKRTLDELISKRGDAVRRSKPVTAGAPAAPHLVRRADLERCIKFLRCLVEATDKAVVKE